MVPFTCISYTSIRCFTSFPLLLLLRPSADFFLLKFFFRPLHSLFTFSVFLFRVIAPCIVDSFRTFVLPRATSRCLHILLVRLFASGHLLISVLYDDDGLTVISFIGLLCQFNLGSLMSERNSLSCGFSPSVQCIRSRVRALRLFSHTYRFDLLLI